MIPLWLISILDTSSVGDFLYEKNLLKISIKGRFVGNEWVVDIYVDAVSYFAWGCNNLCTGIKSSFNAVVRYYLTLVINQLSEYGAEGKKELLYVIKDYLE